tara:strand:- start:403 stop:705 length:303 start_codon:yes stop_codon:yes gene_type:complete
MTKKQNKKLTVSNELLALVNKADDISTTLSEGIGCLRYIQIDEMMDALREVVDLYDLKKQGGISEYGDNEGKYEYKHWSDYVAPNDPKAFDPKKVKDDDE